MPGTEDDFILKLGDREVNLANAFPMTLGDMMDLSEKDLTDEDGNVKMAGVHGVFEVLKLVTNKALGIEAGAEGSVTDAELRGIPLQTMGELTPYFTRQMGGEAEEADRPT